MDELQNTLKDVDMQIVYKRLEARKKNITGDGVMSKKQLASAYRGYHGLESQYHALQHMSNTTMMHTKRKNDQVYLSHVEDMKAMIEEEKKYAGRADRDIQTLRDDFTTQLAYQYVYRNHSFRKYDRQQTAKKPRPASDKPPDVYAKERQAANNMKVTRPLGSVRQLQEYRDELKMKFPPIKESDGSRDSKPTINMLGNKQVEQGTEKKTVVHKEATSFPNIEGAMGVEVKFRFKMRDDDKGSLYSAPAAEMNFDSNVTDDASLHRQEYDMGQNLLQMRQAEKDKLEKRRVLPAPPKSRDDTKKEAWRRILPQPPTRNATVFPNNTKNTIAAKNMIRKEVTEVKGTWTSSSKRQELVDKVKELEKEKQQEMPMPVPIFDRSKPTSEILREYEEYKRQQERRYRKNIDGESDSESIIIRQLSPQPRAPSPVSQRRNEYSNRISSPQPRLEARAGALKRTDSEKFPSVSRTSSYKDIPDLPPEILENALLTAAQRIEKEKERRRSARPSRREPEVDEGIEADTDTCEHHEATTSKRKLPQPPSRNSERKLDRQRIPDRKLEPTFTGQGKMFDTSILHTDRDTELIHSVKRTNGSKPFTVDRVKYESGKSENSQLEVANIGNGQFNGHVSHSNVHSDKSSKNSPRQPNAPSTPFHNTEHDSYAPTPTMQEDPTRSKVPDDQTMSRVNSLTGSYIQIRQRRMNYSHEQYSRTTNAKKQLQLRAKNRRKLQLKNAKMIEENSKTDKKETDKERPSTRVSFNENVIVFQTI